jgi:hypothetical protein
LRVEGGEGRATESCQPLLHLPLLLPSSSYLTHFSPIPQHTHTHARTHTHTHIHTHTFPPLPLRPLWYFLLPSYWIPSLSSSDAIKRVDDGMGPAPRCAPEDDSDVQVGLEEELIKGGKGLRAEEGGGRTINLRSDSVPLLLPRLGFTLRRALCSTPQTRLLNCAFTLA